MYSAGFMGIKYNGYGDIEELGFRDCFFFFLFRAVLGSFYRDGTIRNTLPQSGSLTRTGTNLMALNPKPYHVLSTLTKRADLEGGDGLLGFKLRGKDCSPEWPTSCTSYLKTIVLMQVAYLFLHLIIKDYSDYSPDTRGLHFFILRVLVEQYFYIFMYTWAQYRLTNDLCLIVFQQDPSTYLGSTRLLIKADLLGAVGLSPLSRVHQEIPSSCGWLSKL